MRKFLPLALVLLAGCSDVKKNLGLTQEAPDEFAVAPRLQPLDMPPDFTLLPPGTPSKSASPAPLSEGEKALLNKTGASSVNPSIRKEVDTVKPSSSQSTKNQ